MTRRTLLRFAGLLAAYLVVAIPFKAHQTTQILARMGFFWNASNEKYVDDFINVLRDFMFFRKDHLNR